MFVQREAVILHADADAFFASVEQRDDPRLRGRPTIVGPGVVTAASYEARAYGVQGGMSGRRARRLCPHATFVSPRFSAYTEASKALFEIFRQTAPKVEGLSMEEAFLDVVGLEAISGTPREIATRLRRRVREEVGLPVSVGVARTKVLAKMASRAAKPDGLLVIAPSDETAFLHPLAVESLWGVGQVTAEKLHAHGINTVGELARRSEAELAWFLGPGAARHLHAISRNRDPRRGLLEDLEERLAGVDIGREARADEGRVGAEPAGPPPTHPTVHAVGTRLVARRSHDPGADDRRPAPQA